MTPLLTKIIAKQGFEFVRDKIGLILKTELENQKTLQSFEETVDVYSERITPIGDDETILINILLDSSSYGQKNQSSQEGRTLFFIDIYTKGTAGNTAGTSDSSTLLHRYLGLCRAILSSTAYNSLGFTVGLIAGTQVESFNIMDPVLKEDSEFTRFSRMQFSVRIQEVQEMWEGIELFGTDTNVKLDLTDKGFKYVLNTTQ